MIQIPLQMYVGEDFYLPIEYQTSYCGKYYPQDISGYIVEMQVGSQPFYSTPVIDVSNSNSIILDGPNGKIEIWIPRTLVTPYMFGEWNYAVQVTNLWNKVEFLLTGSFLIQGWC